MSVATVEEAIREINRRISEWKEVGFPDWREDQTRYGIIDPIIRALGWDTADPKECHPEYPRSENGVRVDYAFFTHLDLAKLEEDMPAPNIIVEAKALGKPLDVHFDKLREYGQAQPRMSKGVCGPYQRGRLAIVLRGDSGRTGSETQRGRRGQHPRVAAPSSGPNPEPAT